MSFSRPGQLLVQYSTRSCSLSDRDKDEYEKDLMPLARAVERFPTAALHAEIAHASRSGEWTVKLELALARGIQRFVKNRDDAPQPAFKAAVRSLIRQVEEFEASRTPRERFGAAEVPVRRVRSPVAPDLDRMQRAVEAGDHAEFHAAISIYEDSLRKRIGRRIELHPDAAAQLEDELSIDDCVEAVFLDAFEQFRCRPGGSQGFGDWLETLIDPAIRALLDDPDEVRRNLDFVRSMRRRD